MSIEKSIQSLADAIRELAESNRLLAAVPVVTPPATEKVVKGPATYVVEKVEEVVEKVEEAVKTAAKVEEEVEETKTETSEATLTIDDVRKQLTPIIQEYSPAVVQETLAEMKVGVLSDLDPSKYEELLDRVDEKIKEGS